MVKHVEERDFKTEVLEHNGVVLVDFWATWCGPCKMIAPVIEGLATEMNEVKFTKVDVDKSQAIANQYEISSIPTLMVFKNGEVADKMVGFRPKGDIENLLKKHL